MLNPKTTLINHTRVLQAVAVMQRVIDRGDRLYMGSWQCNLDSSNYTKEEELHKCGTAACFGGWLAVSPEFKKVGGEVNRLSGAPKLASFIGADAVMRFLKLDCKESTLYEVKEYINNVCATGDMSITKFYGVANVTDITPQMVIDKLQVLLELPDNASPSVTSQTTD